MFSMIYKKIYIGNGSQISKKKRQMQEEIHRFVKIFEMIDNSLF